MSIDMRPGFDPDDLEYLDDDPPPSPVGLTDAQRRELTAALDDALRERACDGSLRAAEHWARSARVPWPPLRRALEENGSYCDCEIAPNVFGDEEWE